MKILKSRPFWAALIGLLVLVLYTFMPTLPFTEAQISAFGLLCIAYIFGESLEGARPAIKARFAGLFKSRKFWAVVAGLIAILLQTYVPKFPLTSDQLTNFTYLLIAVITGAGIEGAVQARAK